MLRVRILSRLRFAQLDSGFKCLFVFFYNGTVITLGWAFIPLSINTIGIGR